MATTARQMRNVSSNRRKTSYENSAYVSGSAARRYDVKRELEKPVKEQDHAVRRNREKASYMNLGYVMFLTIFLGLAAFTLIGYIRLEAGIDVSVKKIASMESELNTMKSKNDEALAKIESSIDLEEIKRIAITELGMTYAKEGQIIEIPNEGSDYVMQYAEILE